VLQARACLAVPLAARRPDGPRVTVRLPAARPMALMARVLPTARRSAACPDDLTVAHLPRVAWHAMAALRPAEPHSALAVYGPEARQQVEAADVTAQAGQAARLDAPAGLQRAAVARWDVKEARPRVVAAQRGAQAAPRQVAEARSDEPAAAELLDVPVQRAAPAGHAAREPAAVPHVGQVAAAPDVEPVAAAQQDAQAAGPAVDAALRPARPDVAAERQEAGHAAAASACRRGRLRPAPAP
jgi:hypothetical protein